MADFVKVANTNEIEPGQARLVDVKGKEIALFNVDGEFFALDNTCTHRGGPLAEGEVAGHEVTCPWHGATFDIRTGSGGAERANYQMFLTELCDMLGVDHPDQAAADTDRND